MARGWLFGSDPQKRKGGKPRNPFAQPLNPLAFNPGLANTSITILQQGASTDVSGASIAWTIFSESWAEVKALRGTDAWKSGQFVSEKYMQVTMRYLPGLLSNMRITFLDSDGKTRTLQIQDQVNVLERGEVHQVLCIELDGQ